MSDPAAILEKIIEPEVGGFSQELADYVLSLRFPPPMQARCGVLSEKAQEGNLSEKEQSELDAYLSVNTILILLKSKARASLRARDSAA